MYTTAYLDPSNNILLSHRYLQFMCLIPPPSLFRPCAFNLFILLTINCRMM